MSMNTPPPPPPSYQAQSSAVPAEKPKWWKKKWVAVVAAGVVGIGIGGASATEDPADPKDSAAYKDQASELADTQAQLDEANSQLDDASAELETIAGDLPEREAALQEALGQLEKDQSSLKDQQADVDKREKAVSAVETSIANGTIDGSGLYEVGRDIEAGTWRTNGGSNCYYAVLNSPDTTDIATNNLPDGQAIISLSDGQYFETQDCGEWVRDR